MTTMKENMSITEQVQALEDENKLAYALAKSRKSDYDEERKLRLEVEEKLRLAEARLKAIENNNRKAKDDAELYWTVEIWDTMEARWRVINQNITPFPKRWDDKKIADGYCDQLVERYPKHNFRLRQRREIES